VFGNAQQPVMVLTNLYFFARSARDLAYLDTPTDQILADLADFLGGPREFLVPAWQCLELSLPQLPAGLPAQLRATDLKGEPASCIPGGSRGYLEILAAQVESRRGLLQAVAKPAISEQDAAIHLAAGAKALIDWWQVHRYVSNGDASTPFAWRFVRTSDVAKLRRWAAANVQDPAAMAAKAGKHLARLCPLSEIDAVKRIEELLAQ
jgi:hypothetical protein